MESYVIGNLNFFFDGVKWYLQSPENPTDQFKCNWMAHILNPYREGLVNAQDTQSALVAFVQSVTAGATTLGDWITRIGGVVEF